MACNLSGLREFYGYHGVSFYLLFLTHRSFGWVEMATSTPKPYLKNFAEVGLPEPKNFLAMSQSVDLYLRDLHDHADHFFVAELASRKFLFAHDITSGLADS